MVGIVQRWNHPAEARTLPHSRFPLPPQQECPVVVRLFRSPDIKTLTDFKNKLACGLTSLSVSPVQIKIGIPEVFN